MPESAVLLSLRRTYSKDEAFNFVSQKLREAEQKNGILKSELSEKSYLLSAEKTKRIDLQNQIEVAKIQLAEFKTGLKNDAAILDLKSQLQKYRDGQRRLKDDARIWRDKYLSEIAKTGK